MKTLLLIAVLVLSLVACRRDFKAHAAEAAASPAADAPGAAAASTQRKKVLIPPPMMERFRSLESDLRAFDAEQAKDHLKLAAKVDANLRKILEGCIMEGKDHDTLHEWLIPFISLAKEHAEAKDPAVQTEKARGMLSAFTAFHSGFEQSPGSVVPESCNHDSAGPSGSRCCCRGSSCRNVQPASGDKCCGGCQETAPNSGAASTAQSTAPVPAGEAKTLALLRNTCFQCHNPDMGHGGTRRAPPLFRVRSHYCRDDLPKEEIVQRIVNWVNDPSMEKSIMFGAVRNFGLMPKMGFNQDDLKTIAEYICDNDLESNDWYARWEKFKQSIPEGGALLPVLPGSGPASSAGPFK